MADIDLIVDNRDAAFSTTGWWFIGDGGQSYNGDCAWTPPGTRNIAYVQPESLQVGAYEIFAWWCGNPNRDQIGAALIQIHPTGEQTSPYQVYVNLQENAGLWNSVGTYYLEPGASLSIHSDFDGNVVADAFRFSYRSPEQVVITPTPRPTAFPWTNHPPTPLDQLTQGDLSARLGLVEPYYQRSPVIVVEEHTFDDCQTFPRDGCSGVREGWQVQVQYQDIMITYRVSEDYHFVALEPSAALAARQRLYLAGWDNNELLRFRVDRYPDDTWHISGKNYEGTYTSQTQLDAETLESLQALVQSYSSLRFQTPEGIDLILFGLGEGVELSEADQSRLAALAVKLAAIALAER